MKLKSLSRILLLGVILISWQTPASGMSYIRAAAHKISTTINTVMHNISSYFWNSGNTKAPQLPPPIARSTPTIFLNNVSNTAPLKKAQPAQDIKKEPIDKENNDAASLQQKALVRASHIVSQIQAPQFNKKQFESYANQYGNKAANLNELKKIASSIPVAGPCVQVPDFFAIGDSEIKSFLATTTYYKGINTLHYIEEGFKNIKQHDPFVRPAVSRRILGDIEKVLEKVFSENTFRFKDEKRQKDFEEYIKTVASNQDLFMVRSTGKEDTQELANAGGNKSIVAVWPHEEAISKAIGQVIASYVSEKSLNQRILAGDKTVFDTPFMPVVIQIMVCKDPVSGVIFSQEAEGNTSGVTDIRAAYGHGEGIVNSLIPTDSFIIGPSGVIHPLIRNKSKRFAPKSDFSGLELVENTKEAASNPCLTPALLQDLKIAADAIQNYYSYPVDIEFVVQQGIIYLVQARPIITKKQAPSYLQDEFVKQAQERFSVFPIITASGAVQRLNMLATYNAICTKTIGEALDIFLSPGCKQEKVPAIIIGELAPATSHEATTFRGAGKTVVYCKDYQIIKELINAGNKSYLLDVQRGLILSFDSAKFPNTKSMIVENAWYAHPIPAKTSLFPQFISLNPLIEVKPQECCKGISTNKLLELLKNGSFQEASDALKSILHRLWIPIVIAQQKLAKESIQSRTHVLQLKNLYAHALTCAQEIMFSLMQWENSAKTPQDRLVRLYPITFFEALIAQTHADGEFINDYSFAVLLKTEKQEQTIAKEIKTPTKSFKPFAIQYAKIADYALTPEVKEAWNSHIAALANASQEMQQEFAKMIYELAQNNILPLWLNVSFWQHTNSTPTANTMLSRLQNVVFSQTSNKNTPVTITRVLKEFKETLPLLKQIKMYQTQLQTSAQSNWNNPELFPKLWEQFHLECIEHLLKGAFDKTYEDANLLGKLLLQNYLGTVINTFDTIIKMVKSSTEYKDKNVLIRRIRIMLKEYLKLLDRLCDMSSISAKVAQQLPLDMFISDYITSIEKTLNNSNDLNPTKAFNVGAASLGSKANYGRSIGSNPSLEDMFTLIHQNLLVILRTLAQKINLNQILPTSQLCKQATAKIDNYDFRVRFQGVIISRPILSLIGIEMKEGIISYCYNLALSNHSSTFQLTFDSKNAQTFAFNIQFFGQARSRFPAMERFIKNERKLIINTPSLMNIDKGLLTFSWKITSPQDFEYALQKYKTLISMTYLA